MTATRTVLIILASFIGCGQSQEPTERTAILHTNNEEHQSCCSSLLIGCIECCLNLFSSPDQEAYISDDDDLFKGFYTIQGAPISIQSSDVD